MPRPTLEVADVFRAHGQHWRESHAGHVSLEQLKVMSAVEHCRSEVLGGHVLHCPACEHDQIAYNSCRNRHCPKCQASAAKRWLAARQTELLPVEYYHVVFTLPQPISDLAYYNKSVMYGALLKAAAQTLLTIGADTKHLGARLGVTFVLHTWGSAMTHHPHVHGIIPGGGLSPDGEKWVSCKAGFFLPVRVLSRLFRRLYLEGLREAYEQNKLLFFGDCLPIMEGKAFLAWLNNQRKIDWVVYAKRPFSGPQAVLAYLSRYTHRVAIANSRLVAMDKQTVSFKWKNYRVKEQNRHRVMTLTKDEFIRRFLLHVLPSGFHRIRHYGLTANTGRKKNLAKARQLLNVEVPIVLLDKDISGEVKAHEPTATFVCPCCGAAMIVTEVLLHLYLPRAPPLMQGM
ncbi:transposase [Colwellia sp. MT41]|uniref:IS91 family transposase n=1 Tax=Colwellia sp. MT41 TaxID=58049 RepID=UPI000717A15F|nr:IS91 family transposase [Colwellia sp. MT41]ALO35416.1 transposase [Colwellia sp. MT41]